MPIIVDLYARVSTKEQAENGYSIQEQKERLTKYAEAQGWTIHKLYSDEGFSGSNLNRAGIIAIMQDAEAQRIDKVVVFKLDRLSRSQKDTLHLIEDIFIPNKIDFVSMSESIDTGTSFGMAVIGMMSCFAQLERATIQERMSIGRLASIKEGKFRAGCTVPLGYRYDTKSKRLEIDEFEATLIRRIFEEYATGSNANQIYLSLHHDYPFLKGRFQRMSITRILENRFYVGQQKWNGEYYQLDEFPQFIPDELFEICENRIESHRRTDKPESAHNPSSILCGISWCGYCGARLKFKKGYGQMRAYCTTNIKRHNHLTEDRCQFSSFNIDKYEMAVIDEIRNIKITGTTANVNQERDSIADVVGKKIASIDSQISKLIDLYALGTIDPIMLNGKINELQEQKNALEAEIKKAQSPEDGLSSAELLRSLSDFNEIVDKCEDIKELSGIVHQLIKSITFTKDEMRIQWNF